MDTTRQLIQQAVERKLVTYKFLSELIGRNHAYIQQFMTRTRDEDLPRSADERIRSYLLEKLGFVPPSTQITIPLSRFQTRRSPQARTPLHLVFDTVLQIEVFHWFGDTGKAKCEAVASALNSLGHEID
jgi:hypothetical protein